MSQMLNSIRHILNRECDMAADVDVDVAADMDVHMAIDKAFDTDVDVADDVDADSPCFHGPVSSDPNIFGLLLFEFSPFSEFNSFFEFIPFLKLNPF
jgi:hypothetical protein